MINVNSKVRMKGKPIKGVSFKVLSIDKYGIANIKHSLSGIIYEVALCDLEAIK